MKRTWLFALVLLSVVTSACDGRHGFSAPLPPPPSTLLLNTKPSDGLPVVVKEVSATITVWRRSSGACYLSIAVAGWESFYVDASGPPCETGKALGRVERGAMICARCGGSGSVVDCRPAANIRPMTCGACQGTGKTVAQRRKDYRADARRLYPNITITDHASVTPMADGGAFVEAVVWVPDAPVD